MENFELYEKIETYLKGTLSAEAAQAFESEIEQNADLKEQVELHRLELDAMEVLIENDLRGKMATWKASTIAENTPSVSAVVEPQFSTQMTAKRGGLFRTIVLAAAAAFVLAAGASLWYFGRPKPIDELSKPTETMTLPNPDDTTRMLDGAGFPPIDSVSVDSTNTLQKRK